MASETEHPFAPFVRTLGRGPGRSRALTRDEARDALGMVLRGEADPHQIGAFLMLLRYRGEDPDEVAGLVEAARAHAGLGEGAPMPAVDLDWPSYGAGRTRGAPWYLLAALALAGAGYRVLMHGSNEFSSGIPVADALAELGLRPASGLDDAGRQVATTGFAYLPLSAFNPGLERLLNLRSLLGLRSPINTVARLLDPGATRAGVDGVFHPPYIDLHLSTAARLGRRALTVVKGGGGEAERNPAKPIAVHLYRADAGRGECLLAPLPDARPVPADTAPGQVARLWRGESEEGADTVVATIALALLALDACGPEDADRRAAEIWQGRDVALARAG